MSIIKKRDLSKKVLASLMTMSCVAGVFLPHVTESAGNNGTYVATDGKLFVPDKANFVIANWDEVKQLKDSNAGIEEYSKLLNKIPNWGKTETDIQNAYNLAQVFENVVITNDDTFIDKYSHVDVDMGSNNLKIQGSKNLGWWLFGLYGDDRSADFKGSGTLTIETDAVPDDIAHTLLQVGGNSSGPGQKLNVDMGKLVVKGNVDSPEFLNGIKVSGYIFGSGQGQTDLTVTGTLEVGLENTGGEVRGINIDSKYGTDTSANLSDLTLVVKGMNQVQGISMYGGENKNSGSSGVLNVNGDAVLKAESTGANVYNLVTDINNGGINNVNFYETAVFKSTSVTKQAYGIYGMGEGNGKSNFYFADVASFKVIAQNSGGGIYLRSEDSAEHTAQFQKEVVIDTTSNNGGANGILSYAIGDNAKTIFNFNDRAAIKVNADSLGSDKVAMGIFSQADGANAVSEIKFANGLTLIGMAKNGKVTGIQAESKNGSKNFISIDGETNIITGGNNNDYIIKAYDKGTKIDINKQGGSRVQGIGHIYAGTGSMVNWNMDTDNSFLQGWLLSGKDSTVALTGDGKVLFKGVAKNYDTGGIIDLILKNNAEWQMIDNSVITDLKLSSGAVVDMRADNNVYSTLTTANLSDTGGVIKQDIDVRTMENDKVLVTGDFSGTQALDIYQKDNYVPVNGSGEGTGLVLASVNGNGIFIAKDREGTLFYTHYDLANKASETAGFTTDWYLNKMIKTNESTTSVDTVLSANALNYHTWRTENDKLMQRMGELRHNGEAEQGAWFRVKGTKIGRDGKFDFENKYTTYELGYDRLTKQTEKMKRYQGVALSYTDGTSSYNRGTGDNSSKSINFYTTQMGSKGHYLDLVFKISNMDNDFTVYDTNSNKITGDFNNTGVSLSAEYGRKNDLQNGWYIESQAQFTLGYLGGDNYTASNGINVDQSGIKSAVGRIGFNIGKEVGNKGVVYAKANLLHEFGGGYDVTMTDSTGRVKVSDSFDDTWFEYGIGAALTTGKSSHIYFDVERSAGSDFTKDWQWNIGARWTF